MKKVIYTVLVGNYDNLIQPLVVDEGFDYICFSSDIKKIKVGIWNIRQIPFHDVDKIRISRYPKLLPHRVLQEYDYSLYIDANIQITDRKLYSIINREIDDGVLIAQVPNIFRDCIYKDIEIAYRKRKVNFKGAKRQYEHLRQEQFPMHYGLFENNVILRKHNDLNVIEISNEWWKEYCAFTHRDQFCLMYIYWKHNYMASYLFGADKNARNVDFLKLIRHPRKNSMLLRNEQMYQFCEKFHSLIRKYIWRLFHRL